MCAPSRDRSYDSTNSLCSCRLDLPLVVQAISSTQCTILRYQDVPCWYKAGSTYLWMNVCILEGGMDEVALLDRILYQDHTESGGIKRGVVHFCQTVVNCFLQKWVYFCKVELM
eukprot:jgi/Botrbrau1/22361/Bobra.0002s0038.1